MGCACPCTSDSTDIPCVPCLACLRTRLLDVSGGPAAFAPGDDVRRPTCERAVLQTPLPTATALYKPRCFTDAPPTAQRAARRMIVVRRGRGRSLRAALAKVEAPLVVASWPRTSVLSSRAPPFPTSRQLDHPQWSSCKCSRGRASSWPSSTWTRRCAPCSPTLDAVAAALGAAPSSPLDASQIDLGHIGLAHCSRAADVRQGGQEAHPCRQEGAVPGPAAPDAAPARRRAARHAPHSAGGRQGAGRVPAAAVRLPGRRAVQGPGAAGPLGGAWGPHLGRLTSVARPAHHRKASFCVNHRSATARSSSGSTLVRWPSTRSSTCCPTSFTRASSACRERAHTGTPSAQQGLFSGAAASIHRGGAAACLWKGRSRRAARLRCAACIDAMGHRPCRAATISG